MNIPSTTIISLLIAGAALTACSNNADDNCITYDVTAEAPAATEPAAAKARPAKSKSRLAYGNADKDSEPYRLGREHGKRLHQQCRDEEAVRDEVLDINARITNIQCRIGAGAANDYMHGMMDYLSEVGDTLATTLF